MLASAVHRVSTLFLSAGRSQHTSVKKNTTFAPILQWPDFGDMKWNRQPAKAYRTTITSVNTKQSQHILPHSRIGNVRRLPISCKGIDSILTTHRKRSSSTASHLRRLGASSPTKIPTTLQFRSIPHHTVQLLRRVITFCGI